MTFTQETARKWAISVSDKELEANIVALSPDSPDQTIRFRDGWITVVTSADILTAAITTLAQRQP